jgi:hypothetical protein
MASFMEFKDSGAASGAKDQDDRRGVIALQGNLVDWEYVFRWCDRHGTRGLLDEIRRSIPADLDTPDSRARAEP